MAKPKKKPVKKQAPAAKQKPAKTKAAKKATPAKQAVRKPAKGAMNPRKGANKPTQKRKPPPPPPVPEQILDTGSGGDSLDSLRDALDDVLGGDFADDDDAPTSIGGRNAIHVELGAKLTALRGDIMQERAAIASAIDAFMQLAIANGLAPDASAYTAQCPEFFWEGSGDNPPVYARVPDATHDEIGRWFQLIVEGVRAYDARVGATTQS